MERRLLPAHGPAGLRLQSDLDILLVQLDGLPVDLQGDLAAGLHLRHQAGAIRLQQSLFDSRHQRTQTGAQPFEVRLDLVPG